MLEKLIPVFVLVGCASEPNTEELVIHHADDTGLVGEYRTASSSIHFESRSDGAAAFFDDNGIRLAAQYPNKAPPADWGDGVTAERMPDRAAMELMSAAANALAALELAHGDALVTLGGDATHEPVPDVSTGRCDRYVEYTANTWTNTACHTALSYLYRRYYPCSSWVRYSGTFRDYSTGQYWYWCTAAALY